MFIVTFTRDWFTCFLDVIIYFLFIDKCFATIMPTEINVIVLYMFFYTRCSMPMFGYMAHTHAYSLSWRFWQLWFPKLHLHHLCLISFYIFLSSFSSSTFKLSSLFTSMAFSELSFILLTPNFHVHILLYYLVCFLTLFSLSFSTSSFVLHSKQFASHTSQMWLSTSFLFLNILPQ